MKNISTYQEQIQEKVMWKLAALWLADYPVNTIHHVCNWSTNPYKLVKEAETDRLIKKVTHKNLTHKKVYITI